MYQILKNGKPVCETDDLTTAVKIVRSLEANINRLTQHSPYTITGSWMPKAS